MRQTVIEDIRDDVALFTLNRPQRRNAFNDQQYDDLRDALAAAQANDEVCVAVVTGAGGAFTGGQDLNEMGKPPLDDGKPHGFVPFIDQLAAFEKPLLAAVNGVAVGVGLTMLLHCDIVYVAEGARLRAPFTALGIVPEAGSTFLLPHVVGVQAAADLFFTAGWIDARRAVEIGLAARVVPEAEVLPQTLAKAAEIAAQPLGALRETKRLLLAARTDAVRAARRREDAIQVTRINSPENLEAVHAFQEKRAPDFKKLRGTSHS
jgi:enoyl-CoA hydratase/carnithine racemase